MTHFIPLLCRLTALYGKLATTPDGPDSNAASNPGRLTGVSSRAAVAADGFKLSPEGLCPCPSRLEGWRVWVRRIGLSVMTYRTIL